MLECLHVVLDEEWAHHGFRVRDLDLLEGDRGRGLYETFRKPNLPRAVIDAPPVSEPASGRMSRSTRPLTVSRPGTPTAKEDVG